MKETYRQTMAMDHRVLGWMASQQSDLAETYLEVTAVLIQKLKGFEG